MLFRSMCINVIDVVFGDSSQELDWLAWIRVRAKGIGGMMSHPKNPVCRLLLPKVMGSLVSFRFSSSVSLVGALTVTSKSREPSLRFCNRLHVSHET